jgi:hypothetical protein
MFDKDSLACVDIFFQLFRYMLYFLWELEHTLFEYCSICSCDRVLIGFNDPDI